MDGDRLKSHSELGRRPCQPAYPGKVDRESGCGSFGSNQAGNSVGPSVQEGLLVFGFSRRRRPRPGRETHYRVHGAEPFTLRVDEPSAALAAAHKRFRTDCSAFITACNPFSEDVGAASSAQRHADLGLELARRSLAHIEGIGQHPSNQWPGEASYLVFGLKLEAAKTLGRALRQNAIVWSDADAVPRLILLR